MPFFARHAGCTASLLRSSPSATRRFTSSFPSRAMPTTSPAQAGFACSRKSMGHWRLLTLPSRFDMGLSDCRWEYRHAGGTISVHVIASGEDPALQCTIQVEGEPCRLLVFGHLVLGEHDLAHSGRVEVDSASEAHCLPPRPRTGSGASATRMPSITLSRARPPPSTLLAATSCFTRMASRAARLMSHSRRCPQMRCGLPSSAR